MTTEHSIAALVEHETFVRSLARSLVGDHSLAEDLAQDTWVAALRHPPSSSSSARGWLATVMRNQLRNLRRSNARRQAREAAVAAVDRPETLHERLGLQHLVVEAVLALPSIYREVVLLHFYDGLSAAEISRRHGVPAATVRSQLKRGLDQVRSRLDKDHLGGRASWCALLLAMEREAPKAPPLQIGYGAGFMWGAGALILAAIAFSVLGPDGAGDIPGTVADAPLSSLPSAHEISEAQVLLVRSSDSDQPLALREPIQVAPQRLTAVCRDESGRLVPDAEVWILQQTQLPDGKLVFREFGPFTSNASGLAVGPVALICREQSYGYFVYARLPGRLVGLRLGGQQQVKDKPLRAIEVTLVPSRTVIGKVSIPEGFDTATVKVRVHALRQPGYQENLGILQRTRSFGEFDTMLPEVFESSLNQIGQFEFHDIPIGGILHLIVEAPGLGQAQYANVGKGHVPISDLIELEMLPEGRVAGTVIDPSGASVPGVHVSLELQGGNGIWILESFEGVSDDRGAFLISGLPATEFNAFIEPPRKDLVFRPQRVLVEHGKTAAIDIELEPAVRVTGVVVDATSGTGIEGVAVIAIEPGEFGIRPRLGFSNSDAAGAFELWLPTGDVSIYFASKPEGYAFPDPQITKTFVISEERTPIEDLRFTLQPVEGK